MHPPITDHIPLDSKSDLFRLCPPPPSTLCAPQLQWHVSLHSKSLCKYMPRASGVANNMRALIWGGGTNGEDPVNHYVKRWNIMHSLRWGGGTNRRDHKLVRKVFWRSFRG